MNITTVFYLLQPWSREAAFLFDQEKMKALAEDIMLNDNITDPRYVLRNVSVADSLKGEAVADEIFDITNNPSREEERNRDFPGIRSLSVGDIVMTGDEVYVCCSFGWVKL